MLIPCENAQVQVEAALGLLAASETLAAPAIVSREVDTEETQRHIDEKRRTPSTVSVGADPGARLRDQRRVQLR